MTSADFNLWLCKIVYQIEHTLFYLITKIQSFTFASHPCRCSFLNLMIFVEGDFFIMDPIVNHR